MSVEEVTSYIPKRFRRAQLGIFQEYYSIVTSSTLSVFEAPPSQHMQNDSRVGTILCVDLVQWSGSSWNSSII